MVGIPTYVQMYPGTHMHIYTHIRTCIHTYIPTYTHAYMHAYMQGTWNRMLLVWTLRNDVCAHNKNITSRFLRGAACSAASKDM
jgi:hypothetical protein